MGAELGRGRCFPGFSQGSRTGDDKDMENTKYKVLLVEDDYIDQMAFERLVKEEGLLYDYTICSSAAEAENVLSSRQFDVIITDYLLGDGTALDIFDSMEDTPTIVITGAGDEGIAVEAMKAGACDYLIKDPERNYLRGLPIRVANAVKHKRTEEQLKDYERLKREFIMTVSHELRTPLSVCKGVISNAKANVFGKISSKLQEGLEIADRNIDRLTRTISDFLDISNIDSGKMKLQLAELGLCSVVSEVVEALSPSAAAKNIELKSSVADEELFVDADRGRIAQVLRNLITNAIRFIPENSQITVCVKEGNDDEACVEVADNGSGIERKDVDRIFDRFVQLKKLVGPGEHGTGMGLPIAKALVEMHGGRIWVQSEGGRGCSFCFALPQSGTKELRTSLEGEASITVKQGT